MSKTGKKTPKETPSLIKPLPADHPIFKRGFAIGVIRSIPSPKSTPATISPSSSELPTSSSNPAPSNDAEDSTQTRKENTVMSKTGPTIRKGIGSSIPEAPADHPIYKRGFAIGMMRSIPSSKSTPATTSPSSSAPQALSSNPALSNDEEDSIP